MHCSAKPASWGETIAASKPAAAWSSSENASEESISIGIRAGDTAPKGLKQAGSYLRRIDFVYHSTPGLRVISKKKKGTRYGLVCKARCVGKDHCGV